MARTPVPSHRYWAVIPAAGSGSRMAAGCPKQYLPVCGQPLLQHTLIRFCEHPAIAGVVAVIAADDVHWPNLPCSTHPRIRTVTGGSERMHSVLNGLKFLADQVSADTRVLVHDAARPCVRATDISRLIDEAGDHADGGLLAWPVRDTMKRADTHGAIECTVDRSGLWHALTPQLFPLDKLRAALELAMQQQQLVTDEAQAMERTGYHPRLVQGAPDNIKVTLPSDLALAELFLQAQQAGAW